MEVVHDKACSWSKAGHICSYCVLKLFCILLEAGWSWAYLFDTYSKLSCPGCMPLSLSPIGICLKMRLQPQNIWVGCSTGSGIKMRPVTHSRCWKASWWATAWHICIPNGQIWKVLMVEILLSTPRLLAGFYWSGSLAVPFLRQLDNADNKWYITRMGLGFDNWLHQ